MRRLNSKWRGLVIGGDTPFEETIYRLSEILRKYHMNAAQEVYDMLNKQLELRTKLARLVFDAMNEIAPKGYYFGVHRKRPDAALGFWEDSGERRKGKNA